MKDTTPQDNESIDKADNQSEEETEHSVAEWAEILADRLSDGENLKEVTATIRHVAASRTKLVNDRLALQWRLVRLQTYLRFVIVLLALGLFAAGGWVFSDDPEIVRLLIVSFVSFLGGTIASSAGAYLGHHAGRKHAS